MKKITDEIWKHINAGESVPDGYGGTRTAPKETGKYTLFELADHMNNHIGWSWEKEEEMLWFLIEANKNDEYVTDLEAKTLDEAKFEIIRMWDHMTKDDHKRTTEFYAAFAETDEEDFIDYDSITETWDLLEKIKKIEVGMTYEDETGIFEVTAVLSDTADVTNIQDNNPDKGKEYTVNKSEIAYYM